MADIVQNKNIAALIDPKNVLALTSYPWTAGGASDSATFTSNTVDREGLSTGSLPRCCDVEVVYSAKLASGATLSLYWDLQSAPDNSTFSDFATEASTVIATGPSGGGVVAGIARMVAQTTADNPTPGPGVGLNNAQRYLRFLGVPHLSAAGTDTAVISAVNIVFGGFDTLAAPVS